MKKYEDDYLKSLNDSEGFWMEQADQIKWFVKPEKGLSKDENGFYRWFKGGKLNTSYLMLDYHVENGRGDQPGLIYESPVSYTNKIFTYREMLDETSRIAGMLKGLGVEKGDTVILYMPMIPEVVFSMMACARLGAVHSVVFGGFAANELALRIDDAKPKVLLTASGGIEIARVIQYKPIVDEALDLAQFKIESVVVWQRPFATASLQEGRDHHWQELIKKAEPASWVEVDATDPLYILYTSGTTGKPKGIIRDNGGHAVAMKYSMDWIYKVDPGEVYWAASDVGWVVGHSYIVYAPLIQGCTTILYEGKPVKTPDAGTFWKIIQDHKVSVLFTAPTAIRAIKKDDPEGKKHVIYNNSTLRYLFLAGERCDVATYNWAKEVLEIDIIDHWWQSESGWPMISCSLGYGTVPVKPGSATLPVCGFDIRILDEKGEECAPNVEGAVVIKLPLPPGCLPTLWNNNKRFVDSYLSQYEGYYLAGDGGYKDEDGYIFITGRTDDVINVAGHRLSTADIEEVVASHPDIAECAVVGIEDEFKGHIPVGFVVLKEGVHSTEEELERELIRMVRKTVGPVANFKQASVVKKLPKTRSGKILRKTMRFIADGKDFSMPSTIEDPVVLEDLKIVMRDKSIGKAFQP
ncbi:MAG: acetate--CoA ligase [Cyclobacteriaceae bacterium]|nr:acetate--CoA ligase [Cyclobacteriaceae bacterium]